MPVAATPKYLGEDFSSASPGLRFGMYLELWGVDSRDRRRLWTTHDKNYRVTGPNRKERPFEDDNKTGALKQTAVLTSNDRNTIDGLLARQQQLVRAVSPNEAHTLVALSVAPFTTGLGNEHPLENGFAFLNPYGLPYLPGSGVKGVVRRAAQELASGDWGDTAGLSDTEDYALRIAGDDAGGEPLKLSMIDVLFGREPRDGDKRHVRGALDFWDVMPKIAGDRLAVEIMTPHLSHYYQEKPCHGSQTPHDSGAPTPISFLTVPPRSEFSFHVRCDLPRLRRVAAQLTEDDRWKALVTAAFEHAFKWLGFGAKTAVGYGAMEIDPRVAEAAQRRAVEEAARRRAAEEKRRQEEIEKAEAARRAREAEEKRDAWEALPESRRRLITVGRSLEQARPDGRIDEHRRNQLKAEANRLADEAASWPDAGERGEAAALLEQTYEIVGWHDPGKKPKQREKQIRKKRDAIDRVRRGEHDAPAD